MDCNQTKMMSILLKISLFVTWCGIFYCEAVSDDCVLHSLKGPKSVAVVSIAGKGKCNIRISTNDCKNKTYGLGTINTAYMLDDDGYGMVYTLDQLAFDTARTHTLDSVHVTLVNADFSHDGDHTVCRINTVTIKKDNTRYEFRCHAESKCEINSQVAAARHLKLNVDYSLCIKDDAHSYWGLGCHKPCQCVDHRQCSRYSGRCPSHKQAEGTTDLEGEAIKGGSGKNGGRFLTAFASVGVFVTMTAAVRNVCLLV